MLGAFLLLSLAASAYSARSIRLGFQFRDFFDYPANPALPLFKQDASEFGDPAGYVVAMIEADEVFRGDVLEYVTRLTTALTLEREFARVRSLSSANVIRSNGDDVVSGALMPRVPATPSEMAELRRFALASPLLLRRLVSRDAKTTAVLAELRTPATFSSVAEQAHAIAVVTSVLSRNPPPSSVRVRISGAPVVEVGITQSLMRDQLVLMPAVLAVLVLVLFLASRSAYAICLCLASVYVATLWTAAAFAWFGRPVDIVGSIIPTTILVYGIVDPIFVFSRFLSKLALGRAKNEAIIESFSELALPCFVTSLTTALGFATFVTAAASTIRYFGMTVAIGVLLAWVTTMVVLVRKPHKPWSPSSYQKISYAPFAG